MYALLSYQLTDPTEATFKGGILPFGKNFNFQSMLVRDKYNKWND